MHRSSCTFAIEYHPAKREPLLQSLTIQVMGAVGGPLTLTLRGRGVAPSFSISPVSFPNVTVGQNAGEVVAITNVGELPSGAIATSLVGAGFQLDATSDNCTGITLGANATCTIKVVFAPTKEGPATGLLTVVAPNAEPRSIEWSANATL